MKVKWIKRSDIFIIQFTYSLYLATHIYIQLQTRQNKMSSDNLHFAACKQSDSRVRSKYSQSRLGFVELCAKILQIMRNDFKDYARTFYQLCAPLSALYYTHLAFNIDSVTLYLVYITNMLLHLRRLLSTTHVKLSYRIVSYLMWCHTDWLSAFLLAHLDYCNVVLVGLLMSSPH